MTDTKKIDLLLTSNLAKVLFSLYPTKNELLADLENENSMVTLLFPHTKNLAQPEGEKLPYQGLSLDEIITKHPNEEKVIDTIDKYGKYKFLQIRGENSTIFCSLTKDNYCLEAYIFMD